MRRMPDPGVRRATLRLGARERYWLQWGVVALICAMLAIVLKPMLDHLIQVREFQSCQTNVYKISKAVAMYCQEWDDSLPQAANWSDVALGFMDSTSGTGFKVEKYMKCPLDHSPSVSSYLFNSAVQGLSLTVRSANAQQEASRRRLGHVAQTPMVIERHGSAANASAPMWDWSEVHARMTLPHSLPEATGSYIQAGGRPWRRTGEDLALLRDKRF